MSEKTIVEFQTKVRALILQFQNLKKENEELYAVLKIIGILIAVFLFSVFIISTGVEIGLRAYFEHYKNSKKEEQQ